MLTLLDVVLLLQLYYDIPVAVFQYFALNLDGAVGKPSIFVTFRSIYQLVTHACSGFTLLSLRSAVSVLTTAVCLQATVSQEALGMGEMTESSL